MFFGLTTENYRWLKALILERRLASEKSIRSGTGGDTSQTDRSKNSVEVDLEEKQAEKSNDAEDKQKSQEE